MRSACHHLAVARRLEHYPTNPSEMTADSLDFDEALQALNKV